MAPRVVLCVQNVPVPSDRRVWREACTLRDAGYVTTVIGPGGSALPRRERLDGVDLRRWPEPPPAPGVVGQVLETAWALLWTAWHLAALRARGRIAVLHVANPPDTYVVLGAPLRWLGTRFVFDQHDLCPELLEAQVGAESTRYRRLVPLLRRFERWSHRRADLVVTPNNTYRRLAIERGGVRPEAVVTVRSGPDAVVPAPPSSEGPVVVAFAGMMNVQDRVDVLLDAAVRVLTERPGALRVLLVGTGDDVPRLLARAAALGIASSVEWTGWLTGDALVRALHRASIAVSLDDDSAFSRASTMTKVPEYLALGLPCVIADLPENRVSAGDAAWYFRPGDADDLADTLLAAIDDPIGLAALRRSAAARAPALLWEHSAKRLVAAYAWLLEGADAPVGDQHLDLVASAWR